ncbi:MAG: hypothetical protein HY900_19825 [Deltaproteobacteria bacterium]|nr:hypothetical protein [Deltaproteobacteria bacterium]
MIQRAGLVVSVLALLAAAPRGGPEGVVWLCPLPGSLVTTSPVLVYGYWSAPSQEVAEGQVLGPGSDTTPRPFAVETYRGRAFRAEVSLTPGRNRVVVGFGSLDLLYRPGFAGEESEGFHRLVVHHAAQEGCGPCHEAVDGTVVLAKAPAGVCTSCHTMGTQPPGTAVQQDAHARIVTPDCLRCHEAHASLQPALLRAAQDHCKPCHRDHARPSAHDGAAPHLCGACHDPHGSAHPALLRQPVSSLCAGCHRDVAAPAPYPRSYHRPVMEDRCLECHSPHPSGRRAQLRAPVPDLCRTCHVRAYEQAHEGQLEECRACHLPHHSSRPGLAAEAMSEVCATCHAALFSAPNLHPALADGCISCHRAPHRPRALGESWEVCGTCHNLAKEDFARVHGRLPMRDVRLCTFCHEPHGSNYLHLLKGVPHAALRTGGCLVCHEARAGRVALRYEGPDNCLRCHGFVMGTSAVAERDKVHTPVLNGHCTACHNPHYGTRKANLLDAPLALCLWCHGTRFRAGDRGHSSPGGSGDCYACHDAHFSSQGDLLTQPRDALCARCHGVVLAANEGRRHGAMGKGDCPRCHEAHGDTARHLLRAPADTLCASCHRAVLLAPDGKPWRRGHDPAAKQRCVECHELLHSHRQAGDRFLAARGEILCNRCHPTSPSHVPSNWQSRMEDVRNDCPACHLAHGGNAPGLLRIEQR